MSGVAFPTHKTRWRMFELETEKPITWNEIYDTPVSYTHLRAHETVLDLVCRLLLEKKKNTK